MTKSFWVLPLVVLSVSALGAIPEVEMSDAARAEVDARIREFYSTPVGNSAEAVSRNQAIMSRKTPKYNAKTKAPVSPKPFMKWSGAGKSALEQQAQIKASDEFQKYVCDNFLKKYFPKLQCDQPQNPDPGRATVEGNDKIETLMDTYLRPTEIQRDPRELKAEGKTTVALWSDDYWRLQWGATAYRYGEGKQFKTYDDFLRSYSQPDQFEDLVAKVGLPIPMDKILKYSPAEKYDLTVGDEAFSLTKQQRNHPNRYRSPKDRNVEEWMGICHGWAAAAITVPRADKPVDVKALGGTKVTWNPHDIRAMASLQWANGRTANNHVGGRCNAKNPATYKNGRIIQQDCFDTNPATFTLALGNMIGGLGYSMVMDKDFDYEVWNQPISAYSLEFFNPMNPSVKSTELKKDFAKIAVDYPTFKKSGKDRFQTPLTRGMRMGSRYDDRGIKYIVGVIATVSYVEEVDPIYGPKAEADSVEQETWVYDLELHEEGGKLVAKGGEWHQNAHPDFLWVPRNVNPNGKPYVSVAWTEYDRAPVAFSTTEQPDEDLTKQAQPASDEGYPLCRVVKPLVDAASGTSAYRCRYK